MQTSPGKNDNLRSIAVASTVWDSGSIGLSLVLESRPSQVSLICDFCSSAQNFAHWELFIPQSSFLQIPPRDRHPCLRLMLPTTKRIVDFHHQVIAHAGRTSKIDKSLSKLVDFWQGQKDLNPRPMVLETSTLPTELYPYATNLLY